MARSNPYKKKQRSAKRTCLIYGEGQAEEVFLKYLRGLYAKDSGIAITIKRGKGGTADGIVLSAIRHIGAYDQKCVVLDGDKPQTEMERARKLATAHNISLIENIPCLEGLLLAILEPNENFSGKTSAWCKSRFEEKFIEKKQRTELHRYEKLFPKSVLNTARKRVSSLHELVLVLEGGK